MSTTTSLINLNFATGINLVVLSFVFFIFILIFLYIFYPIKNK